MALITKMSWNREQLNPASVGLNSVGQTRLLVKTDCNFFRIGYIGIRATNAFMQLIIDGVTHALLPRTVSGTTFVMSGDILYEPPVCDPLCWYDQAVLLESAGSFNVLNAAVDASNTFTSVYIDRFYFDAKQP